MASKRNKQSGAWPDFNDKYDEAYMEHLRQVLKKVRLLALDVDGVLTDGSINIGPDGEVFKSFNAKDGLGISCALRNGVQVALLTGRKSAIIHRRAEELGITLLCEGVQDKYVALTMLYQSLGLTQEQVAYMGDDLNDLPAFRAAGIAFAPWGAAEEIYHAADYVTEKSGGAGAVREVVEMILLAQEKWQDVVMSYFQGGQGDKQ